MLKPGLRATLVALLAAIIWSCGDDGAEPQQVASISVSPTSLELIIGETETITATALDAAGNALEGRTVTFTSQNMDIATVTSAGLVTGVGEGSTNIVVESDGVTRNVPVTVLPVPVATVEVEPSELDLVVGQQQALTVTLRDADGNELEDREIAFESDDEAVATVDEAGVVTAAGVGATVVTITSEGQSAQVGVEVMAAPFEPQEDTEVDGDRTWSTVSIPVGVTVTVTADAVLRSLGEVEVAGSLMSDCREVQLISDGPVTVTGTVDTRCTTDPQADGAQLRIVGTGAMTFTGSTVASQGDLTVTNDSTLTLEDFEAAALMGVPVRPAGRALSGPCSYNEISSPARPKPATPDTQGKTGANGKNGRTTRWICDGDADFDGGVYEGQDAGDGEDGTADAEDESQGPAEGGDGGDADEHRMLSSGSMTFRNNVTIRLGNGGKGGDALRVAPPNRSAEAIGGAGGMSGTLTVRAGGGITIVQQVGLTINIGRPGDGGMAEAIGGDGDDSTPTEAAKPGGNATATGGDGGSTPEARFEASGNVQGLAFILLVGGPGGWGGMALARAGEGGDGVTEEFPDGAEGGEQSAVGGTGGAAPATIGDAGGAALATDPGAAGPALAALVVAGAQGTLFVDAGDGGDAELAGGAGGNGLEKCLPFEPGGSGGKGGDGFARGGDGGAPGRTNGVPGKAILRAGAGVGGKAGNGVGPGARGGAGVVDAQDGTVPEGLAAVDDEGDNYEEGPEGLTCVQIEGGPVQGDHTVGVTECDQQIGTLLFTNPFAASVAMSLGLSAGNPFIYTMPSGFGLGPGESIEVGVFFNCGTTTSFETFLGVSGGTSTGIGLIPTEVPVDMNIIQMDLPDRRD